MAIPKCSRECSSAPDTLGSERGGTGGKRKNYIDTYKVCVQRCEPSRRPKQVFAWRDDEVTLKKIVFEGRDTCVFFVRQ